MPTPTYFVQECPTCGRSLRVRIEYLGEQVVCKHCCGQFQAFDFTNGSSPSTVDDGDILRRADELLDSAQLHRRSSQEAL